MLFANLAVTQTNALTLMVWNICQGGQDDYTIKSIYGYTSRLGQIARSINFFAPSVVAIIDAFGWNKWEEGLFEHLFPDYQLQGLHPLGDLEDMNYAILVRRNISSEFIANEVHNMFGNRNFVSLDLNGIKVAITYLEASVAIKREQELRAIIRHIDHDIIVGDLNTIFMEAGTMFASVPRFFQHWRIFGLWVCSKLIRGMFVSPRAMQVNWLPLVINTPTFPLPYFWEVFLKEGIKKYTAWIWRNLLFPSPAIQVDHVLYNIRYSSYDIGQFEAEVLQTNTIQTASDHCPILIKIDC